MGRAVIRVIEAENPETSVIQAEIDTNKSGQSGHADIAAVIRGV